ncbi:DUF2804 domain-containing protein [Vibrio sp. E150_011]
MSASSIKEIESLFNERGAPEYGHLTAIPKYIELGRFRYLTTMDRKASKVAKHFHYKQFQFVSISTPRYIIGIAMADIRYVGNSFFYVYDVETNNFREKKVLSPLGLRYKLTPSPWKGVSYFDSNGTRIEINDGLWRVIVDSDWLIMDVTLLPPETGTGPLMLCTPTGYSGWTYTQKHNALDISGHITVNGETVNLTTCLAGYDFSAGYMRRETSWRWASINALINGVRIGLNLAVGVNESGATENTLWINGHRQLLNGVHFDFDRSDPKATWRIYGEEGKVNLRFEPVEARKEKLNLVYLKSNFRQFIGHFSGTLRDANGHVHQLDNVFGLVEDHYAKW